MVLFEHLRQIDIFSLQKPIDLQDPPVQGPIICCSSSFKGRAVFGTRDGCLGVVNRSGRVYSGTMTGMTNGIFAIHHSADWLFVLGVLIPYMITRLVGWSEYIFSSNSSIYMTII